MKPTREERFVGLDVPNEGGVAALRQEIDIYGYGGPAGCDRRTTSSLCCDLYLWLGDEPRFAIARPGPVRQAEVRHPF